MVLGLPFQINGNRIVLILLIKSTEGFGNTERGGMLIEIKPDFW